MAESHRDTVYEDGRKGPQRAVPRTWKEGDVLLDLYEVQGVIGEGGFGTVYRVYHRDWCTELAVKSPNEDTLASREHLRRHLQEAQVWIDLGLHPHIVSCFYVRELGGIPRIFMEYVPGGTLRARIAKGLELKDALDYAIQICRGMAYAHEKKALIHRDLKPENCLIAEDGTLKITDFGLVKIEEFTGEVAVTGRGKTGRAGTPEYMAPEQWYLASEATQKADMFSFGVILYELITGKKPFRQEKDEPLEAFYARLITSNWAHDEVPSDIPADLRSILEECLLEDPEGRPDSFVLLEQRLERVCLEIIGAPYPRPKTEDITLLAASLNNKAVSLYELGKEDEAQSALTEAINMDPSHPEAVYNHSLLLWNNGQITDADAVNRLQSMQDNHAGKWRPYYILGLVHMLREDAEAAKSVLKQAMDIAPTETVLSKALEKVKQGKGNWTCCVREIEANNQTVQSVAISPDGRFALYGSSDSTVNICDLETGQHLGRLSGHEDKVTSVAFSSDGLLAISGSYDKTVRVWDMRTLKCQHVLTGHAGQVNTVGFSPDGQFAVSGSDDKTLRLWNLKTGEPLRTLTGLSAPILSVAISQDSHLAVSGGGVKYSYTSGHKSELCIWNVNTGRSIGTLSKSLNRVRSVAFSPDGKLALSGSDDTTVCVWDLETGNRLHTLRGHATEVTSVVFSPDGRFVVSGGNDGTVRMWEMVTGKCLRTMERHTDAVACIDISRDGHSVLSGDADGTLILWDLGTGDTSKPVFLLAQIQSCEEEVELRSRYLTLRDNASECLEQGNCFKAYTLLEDARSLLGYERHQELMELRAVATLRGSKGDLGSYWCRRIMEGHEFGVTSVAFSPVGDAAVSGSTDGTVRHWDLKTGKCLQIMTGHSGAIHSVTISPDGRFAVSGGVDHIVYYWDLEARRPFHKLEGHTEWVDSVAISPDGLHAVSGSYDKTVRLWDLKTGKCLRTMEHHGGLVRSVNISLDGLFLISGCDDYAVRLWSLTSGECLRTMKGHTGTVYSVAISPNGRLALSGSGDTNMRLWDLETGKCIHILKGHTEPVISCVISPDGQFAISAGSKDCTLRIWHLESGSCVDTILGHSRLVTSVAVSPDGRFIISGSWDLTLRLWELDWAYTFPDKVEWDEKAAPYLEIFLTLHKPHGRDGISRQGKPRWTEEDFNSLVHQLSMRGFGWINSQTVKQKLEELADATDQRPWLSRLLRR